LDLSLDADSTYGPAWSAKADALYLLRQFDPCIKHLDVCLKYAPDHIPCKLRRAEMHIHLNQYEDALIILNSALRIDDQIPDAYWMKGVIYRETGDLENALSSFQTSIEVNPSFFDGYIALGIAYGATSNPLAVDYYNTAMELRPRSVEAKYNMAMYYQELMLEEPSARKIALEKALALYEAILEIDSMNASAAFNRGYIFLEYLQDYENADIWFSQAIEKLPYYHQAFFNRGLARESMGMNTKALEDYNLALELKPDYTSAALAKGRVLDSK
jgi:tetratricopeptide (TPR) repeat protein